MPKYVFNRVRPPLLRDFKGDVIAIPESDRSEHVGTTSWPKTHEDVLFDWDPPQRRITTDDYTLKRYRRWVISGQPVHFAEPQEYEITNVTGYSKTQKDAFERVSGFSFSFEAAKFGLNAKANEELKINQETIVEWHEQKTEVVKTKRDGNTTYIQWSLLDTLHLIKAIKYEFFRLDWSPYRTIRAAEESYLNNVVSLYHDKNPDPKIPEMQLTGATSFKEIAAIVPKKMPTNIWSLGSFRFRIIDLWRSLRRREE